MRRTHHAQRANQAGWTIVCGPSLDEVCVSDGEDLLEVAIGPADSRRTAEGRERRDVERNHKTPKDQQQDGGRKEVSAGEHVKEGPLVEARLKSREEELSPGST